MTARLLSILFLLPLSLVSNAQSQPEHGDAVSILITTVDAGADGRDGFHTVEKSGAGHPGSTSGVPVVALRTNLLLPLMNIGVEVPLSNRFSLGAGWTYPWLFRNWVDAILPSRQFCAQALAGSLECRWWLGKEHGEFADPSNRLCGHSIGAVLSGGYYDFEYDGNGEQGEFAALGIDYLYALPVGRGGVHFEFNIGIGIALNRNRSYTVPYEGGFLIADGGVGLRICPVPVRAGVSLCIPITKQR